MRPRLARLLDDLSLLACLAGLGVLQFGGAFYPPLAIVFPLLNLAFVLALAVAWLLGRRRRPD